MKYPETEDADDVNHSFYNQLGHVDVRRILHFANEQCGFMNVFDHVLGRYTKSEVDNRTITACIIACSCFAANISYCLATHKLRWAL